MTTTTAADTELSRLTAAVAAMAGNLVELDQNPDRQELGRSTLTGRTATAWAGAGTALEGLWQGHRQLTEVIATAEALRGQRRMTDADRAAFQHQVLGPSITLSTATVPLAQRGLLGSGQVVSTCTPAELLSAMEASFQTAVAVVTAAGEAWRRGVPAAAEAADALQRVRGLTRQAGAPAADRLLDEADRLLGDITRVLLSDPLGADLSGLARVTELVARADAERTSAAELQASLTQRLRDARTLLAELDAAQTAAGAAGDAAAGRFPGEQIITVRRTDPRPELAAIEALAAAGHWALISPRLSAWRRQTTEHLTALQEATARNAALLAERNELRGRLDAYRAKALSRGLGEDPVLSPLAQAARDHLHQAPCDLAAARTAVDTYQDALSATISSRGNR